MSTDTKTLALSKSTFFQDFPEEQLCDLLAIAREVEFRGQEEIFEEGDLAEDVYLITSGKVALVICVAGKGCRQIMEVKEGDLIGWSPILGKSRLSDTALATTPATAIAFNGKQLVRLCEENPTFGYEFMRRTAMVLSERLRAVRRQLVDVHGVYLPEVVLESD